MSFFGNLGCETSGAEIEMGLVLKQTLRSICCRNGWSYGVFWRLDQRNSMLLTFEDAYYEEKMGAMVNNMVLEVHQLNEGIIGQSAATGNHHWVFFDDIVQDDSKFHHHQFSSGIKTIAVIAVGSQGVVQFGSTSKIFENIEFIDQTKKMLHELEGFDGLENAGLSLDSENYDLDGLFDSLVPLESSFDANVCFTSEVFDQFQTDGVESFDHSVSSTWSNEESVLTSFDIPFPDETEILDSSGIFSAQSVNTVGEGETTNLYTIPEDGLTIDISNSYTLDDLVQLFADDSPVVAVSSGFPINNNVSDSVESSMLGAFVSSSELNGNDMIVPSVDNDLFDALNFNFGCQQDSLSGVVTSGGGGGLKCQPDLNVGSTGGTRKGLFSELGLEELLGSMSSSSSITNVGFGDNFSVNKKRKTESSSSNCSQVRFSESRSSSMGSMNLTESLYNWKTNNNVETKHVLPKSQVGLWIDDSYSVNGGKTVLTTSKKLEEPMKTTRKRARPGESTRPRPKDRQQIQDRIKELKGIIPNGAKQSIDALLDLTIKHMLFLQSVTKYADKLKQVGQPKLIDNQNELLLKDNVSGGGGGVGGGGGGGATWAYDVGGQTTVCPIIVEDLNPPGHMLIEMLCEERGYFLEIADIIRGFGLNIVKGVMEVRDTKIWAHFIVEANRHVTRLDVFWSLVELLQQIDSNAIDGGIPSMSSAPLPVNSTRDLR